MIEMPPALDAGLAHPRLLRVGQPQRQGDLPALHRLVRRATRPTCGSTRREAAGDALRAGHRRRRRHRGQGPGVLRRRRPALRRRAGQPRRVRRPGRHGAAARLLADVLEQLGLRRRERDLAQRLPHRRARAPHRHDRAHRRQQRGAGAGDDDHPAVRLRSPSASSGRRPGTSACRSPGTSPTPASTTAWSSATARSSTSPPIATHDAGPDRHADPARSCSRCSPRATPTAST